MMMNEVDECDLKKVDRSSTFSFWQLQVKHLHQKLHCFSHLPLLLITTLESWLRFMEKSRNVISLNVLEQMCAGV